MHTINTKRDFLEIRNILPAACALTLVAILSGCAPESTDEAAPQVAPTQPMAVKTPPPLYPAELACAGIAGQVGVILTIGADGVPKDVRVEDSSGHPQLDQYAVDAVKGWEFQPGTSRGKPTETPLRVPVTFTAPDMDSDRCAGISGSVTE